MTHSDSSTVEQQQHIYESLSRYFDEHENEVIEIEVLPPAIEPTNGVLMQDGSSLGIPKKALISAFLVARQVFFENKSNSQTDSKVQKDTLGCIVDSLVFQLFISLTDPLVRRSKRPRLYCCLIRSILRLQTSVSAGCWHFETQTICSCTRKHYSQSFVSLTASLLRPCIDRPNLQLFGGIARGCYG